MSDQRRLPAGAQGGAPGDPRSPLVGRTSDLCSSGTDPTLSATRRLRSIGMTGVSIAAPTLDKTSTAKVVGQNTEHTPGTVCGVVVPKATSGSSYAAPRDPEPRR
jgi:hypothetical protein